MPIYEFQCRDCGEVFNKLYRDSLDKIKNKIPNCNKCKGFNVRRIMSLTQSRFGRDFYEEEFKRGAFD